MDILVERFLQEEAQTFCLEINVDNNPCDDITRAVASLGKEARPGRNWIHISFLIICHFQEWWKDNLAALYSV